jgi:hypothetical protein
MQSSDLKTTSIRFWLTCFAAETPLFPSPGSLFCGFHESHVISARRLCRDGNLMDLNTAFPQTAPLGLRKIAKVVRKL